MRTVLTVVPRYREGELSGMLSVLSNVQVIDLPMIELQANQAAIDAFSWDEINAYSEIVVVSPFARDLLQQELQSRSIDLSVELVSRPLAEYRPEGRALIVCSDQNAQEYSEYDYLPIYCSRPYIDESQVSLWERFLTSNSPRIIVFTSPFGVEAFQEFLTKAGQVLPAGVEIIALGERIGETISQTFPEHSCTLTEEMSYSSVIESLRLSP